MFNRDRLKFNRPLLNKPKSILNPDAIIHVYSIDLQILFNSSFVDPDHQNFGNIIKAGSELLETIINEANKLQFTKCILMLGSTAQSYSIDRNLNRKIPQFAGPISRLISDDESVAECPPSSEFIPTSSFLELTKLHEALKKRMMATVILDTTLLADISANEETGYSFDLALRALARDPKVRCNVSRQPYAICDPSKILILYAQLNKLAAENEKSLLVFNFYTSKQSTDVDFLVSTFEKNPELIPKNITLKLHSCDEKIIQTRDIRGEGVIDYNFKENVKRIANRQPDTYTNSILAHAVDKTFDFKKFIQERNCTLQDSDLSNSWEFKPYESLRNTARGV